MESYLSPLRELVKARNPKNGLEIGFGYEGYSAHTFLDNCDGRLTSVDKGDWQGKATSLSESEPRFTFIQGRSGDVLPTLTDKYDWIYIDGDHAYEGSKRDMELCIPLLAEGGHIVLDDCDVPFPSAIDLTDSGDIITGDFGVGRAADEVFGNDDWIRVEPPEPLANGGRVYAHRTA